MFGFWFIMAFTVNLNNGYPAAVFQRPLFDESSPGLVPTGSLTYTSEDECKENLTYLLKNPPVKTVKYACAYVEYPKDNKK